MRILPRLLAMGLAYYIAARIDEFAPQVAGMGEILWPAGGVALAAFLLTPRNQWLSAAAVIALADLLGTATAERPLLLTCGHTLAHVLEAWGCAAIILRSSVPRVTFSRTPEVVLLLLSAVCVDGVAVLVGGVLDAATSDAALLPGVAAAWIAHALGTVLVAPLIVTWVRGVGRVSLLASTPYPLRVPSRILVELALFTLIWCVVAFHTFLTTKLSLPLGLRVYVLLLLLTWPALRFGPRITLAACTLLGLLVMGHLEHTPSALLLWGNTPVERLLLAQVFLVVTTAAGLLLCAGNCEGRASAASLRQSEEQIRVLSENLPDSVVYQLLLGNDGDLRFAHLSASVEQVHGLDALSVVAEPVRLFAQILEEDRERFIEKARQSLESMQVFDEVVRMRRADGALRWMQVRSAPRVIPDVGVLWDGIETDITARVRAEQSIRETDETFRQVVENVLDYSILTLDASGHVASWNAGAERIMGFSEEDIVGQPYARFFRLSDARLGHPETLLRIAASSGRSEEQGWRLREDGSCFWANVVLIAQRDETGQLRGYSVVTRDLTERQRADKRVRDSEAQFRAFMRNSPSVMFIKDLAGRYLHVNERFLRQHDLAAEDVLQRTDGEIFNVKKAALFTARDVQVIAQGKAIEMEEEGYSAEGARTSLVCKFPIHDDSGSIIALGGIVTDITARRIAEEAVQRHAVQQSLIAEFGQFALQNPKPDELIAQAAEVVEKGLNPELSRYLELSADDLTLVALAGRGWDPLWNTQRHFSALDEFSERYAIGVRETLLIEDFEDHPRGCPSVLLKSHGVRSAAEVLVWGAEGAYGMLGVYSREPGAFTQESLDFLQGIKNTLSAAIDRRRVEERLAHLAQFDALTGLPNRNLYLDRLWQTISQSEREKKLAGVLFVDVDRFKTVNDKLGHGGADQLLAQLARRLEDCTRSGDTVARLSGDEFAVVLQRLARAEDSALVAQSIVTALSRPFRVDGQEIYVSVSIGISVYPNDGANPDTLLKNADTAMYRAKEAGRNTFRFYLPEMNERAAERVELETELRGALLRHEFLLHYQPKVNIATGEISGFEALLRWQHPRRGLIPPGEFIPILEETGLIDEVGEWVITQACKQIRTWQSEGIRPCAIAVNLSGRQFKRNNLDLVISRILNSAQIDPSLLEFELTESMLMTESEDAANVLENLKSYGIRLSVDDFGTGYSSLTYLKRFPLDALKIDRSFIRDLTSDPDDATIAEAIIKLAHSLKLKVVAEGVETVEQLEFLRSRGCDEMQGFYFSRPVGVYDCTRLLLEGARLPAEPIEGAGCAHSAVTGDSLAPCGEAVHPAEV